MAGLNVHYKSSDVAGIYDKARGIPENVIIEAFEELFSRTEFAGKGCSMLDAGCGTGRITFPVAKRFPNAKIMGIDISEQMLGVLEAKVREAGLSNYAVRKANLLELREKKTYDFSVVSSVLHLIKEWQAAVDRIADATRGFLVFVTETSDMYELALDRRRTDGLLGMFWGRYSELRRLHSLQDTESTQVGIKWQLGMPDVMEYLNGKGLRKDFELSRSWRMQFTVGELLEIVEKRAYSSMFAADERKYALLVSELRDWLREERIPLASAVETNNEMRMEVVNAEL